MTTKEIQAKLIDHYSLAIERVKGAEKLDEARRIIKEMHVGYGVCGCSKAVFKTSIAIEQWVRRNNNGFYYWCPVPYLASTMSELLSALRLRLDILKKEYSLSIETIK